jgi:hypothetical protein
MGEARFEFVALLPCQVALAFKAGAKIEVCFSAKHIAVALPASVGFRRRAQSVQRIWFEVVVAHFGCGVSAGVF